MAWLVDTHPLGPCSNRLKGRKVSPFSTGGWEAYRGTGAIGKKVATQEFEGFLERKV